MIGRASTKQLALISAILASTIAAVDSTAVNVALPAIGRDLGGGFAAQQWVANAYLLTLSALILLAGSLTDRLGERRVFLAGVGGFGIGSALCALSPTIGVLIVARALQGVSGAMLTPAALAIIVSVFPKEERGARDRQVDRLGRDRDSRRTAARRRDRRRRVVAVDLPDQRADRDRRDHRSAGSRSPAGRLVPETTRLTSRSTGPARRWRPAAWPGSRSR